MSEFLMVKRELLEALLNADSVEQHEGVDRELRAVLAQEAVTSPQDFESMPDWAKVQVLRNTVEDLRADIEKLEAGKCEPILIQSVAVVRQDDEEGLYLEWLLEGGICELEIPGTVLFAMPDANDLCEEDGSAEIYTSPPAPVSVVLPERREFSPQSDAEWGWNACLDKVKELNQ